jgi:methyl coenzyme M reductase subunit C
MQDKSIDGALLALRKNIIRGNLDGLAHVEALLILRQVHMPAVLPAKKADVARRGQMTRLVMDALRSGPKTTRQISAIIATARPEISPDEVHRRTEAAMCNMRYRGEVVRDGRLWGLAR